MPVEIFTRAEFEKQALPVNKETGAQMWSYIGLQDGEHAYMVPLNHDKVAIEVRSSIDSSGKSAATGKDSIRCWLVDEETGKPMGSKISRWTTRVTGWGERTKEVIRQLWQMGQQIKPCPNCKVPAGVDNRLRVFKVKKEGPSKGKLFLKCPCEGCKTFIWLNTDEDGELKPVVEQKKAPVAKDERHGVEMPKPCPDCNGLVKQFVTQKEGANKGKLFYSCQEPKSDKKGCGFFQWVDESPVPKKIVCLAVELPEDQQKALEDFMEKIGGKVCF